MARSRVLSFQIMERHGGRPSATAVVEIIVVFEKTRSRPGLGRFSQKNNNHLLSDFLCYVRGIR